jgi:hypothetical protein
MNHSLNRSENEAVRCTLIRGSCHSRDVPPAIRECEFLLPFNFTSFDYTGTGRKIQTERHCSPCLDPSFEYCALATRRTAATTETNKKLDIENLIKITLK